ncbi:hypothetical protein PIB30_052600 [Stylosanthes scabra]|uniref:Uncharacterized protein n=1 Tax=Stylosanthes scabra TaxID=79078 RepID=A0ABU6RIM4_9FABA|nr:hypothetical protein [Stylosanthes scabra]
MPVIHPRVEGTSALKGLQGRFWNVDSGGQQYFVTHNNSVKPATNVKVPHTKFVDRASTSSRTRSRAAAEAAATRELTPFNEVLYDNSEHYERSKLMRNKKILNERVINFEGQGEDFMKERIEGLGWTYMYNDLVDINVTIVKEFYSNFLVAEQRTVYLRGAHINIDEDVISSFLGIQGDPITKAQDAYEINLAKRKVGRMNMDDVLATIAAPGMR